MLSKKQFTEKKRMALYYALHCYSWEEIAGILKVDVVELNQWRHDPIFQVTIDCVSELLLTEHVNQVIKDAKLIYEKMLEIALNVEGKYELKYQCEMLKILTNSPFEKLEAIQVIRAHRLLQEKKSGVKINDIVKVCHD